MARGADANQRNVGFVDRKTDVSSRRQMADCRLGHELVQAWLVDRRSAIAHEPDSLGIDVDADDLMAGLRQARRGHTPDLPETEHAHLCHRIFSTSKRT